MYKHHSILNDRQRFELAQRARKEFWERKARDANRVAEYGEFILRPC